MAEQQTHRVVMERHRDERRHSTFTADVPLGILTDPVYFDEWGEATTAFDQWMCDNGHESGVEHTEPDDHDDEDLFFEAAIVGTMKCSTAGLTIGDEVYIMGPADEQGILLVEKLGIEYIIMAGDLA